MPRPTPAPRRPLGPNLALLDDPLRAGLLFATANVVVFVAMSVAQFLGWAGLEYLEGVAVSRIVTEALTVAVANIGYGLLIIGGFQAFRSPLAASKSAATSQTPFASQRTTSVASASTTARSLRRGAPFRTRVLVLLAAAIVVALPRALLLATTYSAPDNRLYILAEWLAGALAGMVAVGAGALVVQLVGHLNSERDERLAATERAAQAVDELQAEEIRVRRMVSDQLHGNLQYQLLTVTAGLDAISASLTNPSQPTAEHAAVEIRDLAERLEEIRETEVRRLSHEVFPDGVEVGFATAVDSLLRRLPPQIATSLTIGPTYRAAFSAPDDDLRLADRLVAVYAVEEAVANALKHGHATQVDVDLDLAGTTLVVTVTNNGAPLPEGVDLRTHGLARHADRLTSRGGNLELRNDGRTGEVVLEFALPITGGEPE